MVVCSYYLLYVFIFQTTMDYNYIMVVYICYINILIGTIIHQYINNYIHIFVWYYNASKYKHIINNIITFMTYQIAIL
jgi:hypothetical protein